MITLDILNKHFDENPDDRAALAETVPAFKEDMCYVTRKTNMGITPRKSVYIDGKRHTISIRSIAAYFVLGRYEMWVPNITCQPGCINPHHQLTMGKGVHAQQPKLTQAERAAMSLAAEFMDVGPVPPLGLLPEGVTGVNRLKYLKLSSQHDFKNVKAGHEASTKRTLAAE